MHITVSARKMGWVTHPSGYRSDNWLLIPRQLISGQDLILTGSLASDRRLFATSLKAAPPVNDPHR